MKLIYSKLNCPACLIEKSALDAKGVDYKEIMIGKDITREDFMAKFPHVRSVPYVVEDNNVTA